ncbi:MAG: adenylosuccinate lyase [Marinirhabdus sp.]
MKQALFDKINYDKAYRKNRLRAAQWVLQNPENFEELLHYCFVEDKQLAKKATWVLEFVCRENLLLLYPHLCYFFENLHRAQGDGALRAVALICELLAIAHYKKNDAKLKPRFTQKHKETMTENCFDWLITPQKVACQARAMTALYFLGTEMAWVHPELKTIIETNLHKGSAGYQNRGAKTIEKILKYNKY